MLLTSIMLYALGMMVGIAAILYVSYVGLIWFVDSPFSHQAVIQWIGFVVCMALVTGSVSYFIPEAWQELMALALVHFGCMLGFHVFILKIEEFLRRYCKYEISNEWLYFFITLMYLILCTNCVAMLIFNSRYQAFMHVAQMAIEYFTRTALLLTLLLDIKLRRTNFDGDFAAYQGSDDYQDYDNQW